MRVQACVGRLVPRADAGPDRGGGSHGQWQCEGKVAVERLNFSVPDDGRQTEGRFEHGEVIANARSRSATKRQELPDDRGSPPASAAQAAPASVRA